MTGIEGFPFAESAVVFVIRQLGRNDENLEIGNAPALDIGGFAKHVFKVVVGVLRVVLHHELDGDACHSAVLAVCYGNVHILIDIPPFDLPLFAVAVAKRLYGVIRAQPCGQICGYRAVQDFQFFIAARMGLQEFDKRCL